MKRIGAFKSPAAAVRYHKAYHDVLSRCPVPDKQVDVETSFGTTRVYRWGPGDAPPIVLLSGMAGTAGSWAGFLPALSRRHPVYAIDTLGEPSLSVQTAPLPDQDSRARWLDEVLAGLGVSDAHLVGGSMGGYYAVNQAIRSPGRLASVTFVDSVMVTSAYRVTVLLGILLVLLTRSKWMWRRTLRWWTGNRAEPGELDLIMAGIETYRAKLPPVTKFTENQIRSITLPVLAVFAGRSTIHDAALAAERARKWLPDGEVEVWADSGHYVTDPDRLTGLVLEFVGKHTGHVNS